MQPRWELRRRVGKRDFPEIYGKAFHAGKLYHGAGITSDTSAPHERWRKEKTI